MNIKFLILSFIFVSHCVSAYKGLPLPKEYYVNESIVPNFRIETDKDGNFDQKKTENLLKNNIVDFPLLQIKDTKKQSSRFAFKNIKIIPQFDNRFSSSSRALFKLNMNYQLSYLFSLKSESETQYLVEYELRNTNPQYYVKYIVQPVDLLRRQKAAESNGQNEYIIFSKWFFAPEMFYMHALSTASADASVNTLFVGSTSADIKISSKTSYSNRFIIRLFENKDAVTSLGDTTEPMFVLDSDPQLPISSSEVDATTLRVKYKNSSLKISSLYANHLNSENVYFDCSNNKCKNLKL